MDSSDEDYETMMIMYESKRYTWALFIGHLVIEKLLKAHYVKVWGAHPKPIHNLLRLAELTDLDIADDRQENLAMITAFNLNARYDSFERSFYNQCTPEFTAHWVEKINEIRIWIKEQINS